MTPFEYEIPVRFADVDRAGILYYPRFLNYFHIAFEEFFNRALGIPYADAIQRDRVGFPMRRLDVDFRAPLSYGDAALVGVRVVRIGRTSVEFEYDVRSKRTGHTTTIGRGTTVAVNLDTFQAIDVPEPYRSLLAARIEPAGGAAPPEGG
jgi:4-hydroxybenzoyl-CoA thioesterase